MFNNGDIKVTDGELKKQFCDAIERGIHPCDHAFVIVGGTGYEDGEPIQCILIDGNVTLENFVRAAKVVEKYLENKAP